MDDIGATGWGLFHATEVAIEFCDFRLKGARFAIPGFGAVGKRAARFLADKGAVMVAAADSMGATHNPDGLDVYDEIAKTFAHPRRRQKPMLRSCVQPDKPLDY